MNIYIELFLFSLLPIAIALGFYFIDNYTKFSKIPYWIRQIIIGVVFGCVAVLATRVHIEVEVETVTIAGKTISKAYANVRDASPLLAGLMFGGPSGIIAGIIGGFERAFEGGPTVVGCSVSTALAGFFAAALRKFLFKEKRVKWWFAVAIAIVMEVIHFIVVFITNISTPTEIMKIIEALCFPMFIASGFALFVPTFVVQVIHHKENPEKHEYKKVSTQVQLWLLISFIACYLISTTITYIVQTNSAYQNANQTFELTVNDVKNDVQETTNTYLKQKLINLTREYDEQKDLFLGYEAGHYVFENLASEHGVSTLDLIDANGHFVYSSTNGNGDELGQVTFNMTDNDFTKNINDTMSTSPADYVLIREFQRNEDEGKYIKYAYSSLGDGYYMAIGLDTDDFYDLVDDTVTEITTFRRVLTEGYILIFNGNNELVSDVSTRTGEIGITASDILKEEQGKRIRTNIYNKDSFYMYTVAETYIIAIVLPYNDVLFDRDSSFMLNSFMEIIVFAVLFILIYSLLDKMVVNKIEIVTNDLAKIINGDLDVKVDVKSSREFASLSNDINYTVDTLKKYIDEAAKRIDDELAFAKAIQLSALPSTFPAFPDKKEFDIHATMNTAKEVGGDFYDFYIIDNENLAFLIADVSGKGVPAAMFMMESKAMLKNLAKSLLSPEEVISKANDGLAQNNDANMFVTCWFGVLNFKTGHVKFANAGHNNPLIYRKDGKWEYIEQKRNMVLAAMEGMPYMLQEFDLNPGDRIYLYTDGVTEANNKTRELYGEERLNKFLNENVSLNLKDTLLGVKSDIDKFADGADQFDDITMLAIEFRG